MWRTITMTVNPEYVSLVPSLNQKEFEQLKESIKKNGLYFPIVVNQDKIILDGHSRLRACKELGVEPQFEVWRCFENDSLSEKEFVVEVNLRRRHLSPFARAELGVKLLEIESERAKQRMLSGKTLGSNEHRGKSRDIVAEKVNLSPTTFQRALTIIEKAPENVKQKLRNGKPSISYVYQQIKRKEKHMNPPDLPKGEFDVIYADPPWKYDYGETDGTADIHYQAMETNNICNLTIPSAKDSILFLWATNPKLEDALKVMDSWGFRYLTNLVWIKGNGGIGYYLQGNHELLLFGKKGDIPAPMPNNRPSSVLEKPKTRHSSKPMEVYSIIEKMYPNRKYLELFARTKRKGWTVWGDQIEHS